MKEPDQVLVMKAVADEAEESEEISEIGVVVSKVGVSPGNLCRTNGSFGVVCHGAQLWCHRH